MPKWHTAIFLRLLTSGRESGCGLLPAKSVWLLLAASQTLCLPHPKVGKTVLHQLPITASIPSFSPGSGLRTQRLASGTKAFIYIFPCSLWNPTFPPLAAIQQIVAVAGLPPSACLQLLGADRAPQAFSAPAGIALRTWTMQFPHFVCSFLIGVRA